MLSFKFFAKLSKNIGNQKKAVKKLENFKEVCMFATSKHVLEGGMVEKMLPAARFLLAYWHLCPPTKGRKGLLAASYTILKCS